MSNNEAPLIYKKIIDVMKAVGAISKSRDNKGQGYKFRGIDDIYNELHDHLATNGVFTVPEVLEERTEERTTKSGSALIYRILRMRYSFFAEDGSNFSSVVIGEGMDSGDKAANKAMSAAHKYAFLQVFAIATEESKDSENDSHDLEPKGPKYSGSGPDKQLLLNAMRSNFVADDMMGIIASAALKDRPLLSQLAQYVNHHKAQF